MGKFQKILTTSIWGVTVVMMIFIVTVGIRIQRNMRASANSPTGSSADGAATAGPVAIVSDDPLASITEASQLPMLFNAPTFHLLDQRNQPFGSADLHGKPYVCQFIYTTCPSLCPMMLAKMARLQQSTDARLQLVSFSVDPTHDRPAVLKAKAESLDADDARWHFLTNPDGESAGESAGNSGGISAVQRGFLQGKPNANEPITMHSDKFILVDGQGHVRGIYSSNDQDQMIRLKRDAGLLMATVSAAPAEHPPEPRAAAPAATPVSGSHSATSLGIATR